MRTSKPIATISYNSDGYLVGVLEKLRERNVIEFWAFINHDPEEDETKAHKHVFVVPAKMLQTVDLQKEFAELDMTNIAHPKGVIMFVSSKFDDWYMYGLHDEAYLASKGQARKYHYLHQDFVTCDTDTFNELVRRIDHLSLTPYKKMVEYIWQGFSWSQFFKLGVVPISQINQYRAAWETLAGGEVDLDSTYRHGKDGHE